MDKKNVAIMFGGDSAEHEVSIITGLQVVDKIDKEKYKPYVIFMDKDSRFYLIEGLKNIKDYFEQSRDLIKFGRDDRGAFIQKDGVLSGKIYLDAAYLAFHGGSGEGGQVQGLCETIKLPFTSPSCESSVITMSKSLSKAIFKYYDIPTVPGVSVMSSAVETDIKDVQKLILSELELPLIVKPTHFGSSIGIEVVKNETELEKALIQTSKIDSEILIEKFIKEFVEYNVSARLVNGDLELSEIERPLTQDEILSFADKYERGDGKKSGSGMASLERELPAKISEDLKKKIEETSKRAFKACRCKGMVRIDFMVVNDAKYYLTEINSIPGSMSFFLWEPKGITFTEQITELLEQAIKDQEDSNSRSLDYKTDIVEKFVDAFNN